MATNVDWIARLRTAPSAVCPAEDELRAFAVRPEDVTAPAFSHIVGGCASCRTRLQEMLLHPSLEALEEYLQRAEDVPEEVVFHCMSCEVCQSKVREVLGE